MAALCVTFCACCTETQILVMCNGKAPLLHTPQFSLTLPTLHLNGELNQRGWRLILGKKYRQSHFLQQ